MVKVPEVHRAEAVTTIDEAVRDYMVVWIKICTT